MGDDDRLVSNEIVNKRIILGNDVIEWRRDNENPGEMQSVLKTVAGSGNPGSFSFYGVNRTIDWAKALIQSVKVNEETWFNGRKHYCYHTQVEEGGKLIGLI